jgi:hypothetical protein
VVYRGFSFVVLPGKETEKGEGKWRRYERERKLGFVEGAALGI